MELLACENLSLGYDGQPVLAGLSFSIEEGSRLCIIGENGSGKSTLVKGLLGLMPPLDGVLRRNSLQSRQTGYLPQESAVQQDFPASVFEVVLSGRQNRRGLMPFYSKADKAAVLENLETLGIGALRRRSFRELSGGQRRRVLLARALCAAEKLLVLDEPAAGLDPLVQAEVYKLLDTLNRGSMAVIMVSHDLAATLEFAGTAGKLLHLDGRQVFFGNVEAYKNSEAGKRFAGLTGSNQHPSHFSKEEP